MGGVSTVQHATVSSRAAATNTERLAAIIEHAQRARGRAEQMARAAQAHQDRADAARGYAEQAADRITGGRRDQ